MSKGIHTEDSFWNTSPVVHGFGNNARYGLFVADDFATGPGIHEAPVEVTIGHPRMFEVVGSNTIDNLLVRRPPVQGPGTGLGLIGKPVGVNPQTAVAGISGKRREREGILRIPHDAGRVLSTPKAMCSSPRRTASAWALGMKVLATV